MNESLKRAWDRAFSRPGEKVEIGAAVVCDVCNGDYTDRTDSGGFIFGSSAYCPTCAERALPRIKEYGEEWYIRARCPRGTSFADFVREYRGPDAFVRMRK